METVAARDRFLAAIVDGLRNGPPAPQFDGLLHPRQQEAADCLADELLFGGAAGGGKTYLLAYLARTQHRHSLLLRRTYPELKDSLILETKKRYLNSRRYNNTDHEWAWPDEQRRIALRHLQHEDDVHAHRSAQYDFIGLDEGTTFTEFQYVYLLSRLRTTTAGQRTRAVICTNPGGEGHAWIRRRWAAWLDPNHPRPAMPGELRWYRRDEDGREVECTPDHPDAVSRTFIPSKRTDNPSLSDEYRKRLSLLPEPLRSMLLNGDWSAEEADAAYQVIPRGWVMAAMARWTDRRPDAHDAIGVDVAEGGDDDTCIVPRRDVWFDLIRIPGRETTAGPDIARRIQAVALVNPEVWIDSVGVGADAVSWSRAAGMSVYPYDARVKALRNGLPYSDRSGVQIMRNLRAAGVWHLRELLDPAYDSQIALPNDTRLLEDLCSYRYLPTQAGIALEEKGRAKQRLGRSPDAGDAVVMAAWSLDLPGAGSTDWIADTLSVIRHR